MQGVILAAGGGTRLKNLTTGKPKALIPVLGKPLLEYCLNFLNKDACEKIIIVTGFKSEEVVNFLNNFPIDYKKIVIVHNPHFELGNIVSLKTALPHINDSFLLMNVDHIYYHPQIFDIISKNISGITAVCDFDRTLGEDDMKILLNKKSCVIKINKSLQQYTGGYTGITTCQKKFLDVCKEAVNKVCDMSKGNTYVEEVLQYLCDHGVDIRTCDISNLGWVEVDTKTDLQKANETLREFHS